MTTRKAAAANTRKPSAAPHGRSHSLAPEHLGELGSAAALAVAISGLALVVTAGAMIVGALTLGTRYAGATPPPGLGQLGLGQLLGGIGLMVLSIGLLSSSLALLANLRQARRLTIALATIAALLAAAGVVFLFGASHRDDVLVGGLGVAALVFGAAAFILARQRA